MVELILPGGILKSMPLYGKLYFDSYQDNYTIIFRGSFNWCIKQPQTIQWNFMFNPMDTINLTKHSSILKLSKHICTQDSRTLWKICFESLNHRLLIEQANRDVAGLNMFVGAQTSPNLGQRNTKTNCKINWKWLKPSDIKLKYTNTYNIKT